jgi:cytochrome b6-f complex iron-sulfur subunit
MSSDCPECDPIISRRRFISVLASFSLGATALFSVAMVSRAVLPPGRSIEGKTKPGPQVVGTVDELQPEDPVLREYGDDVIFLTKLVDDTVLVMDAACPHVACKLAWNPQTKEFDCPCHASAFTIEGELLYGPAPRDMIPAKYEIVDGEIIVSGFEA